MAEWPHFGDRKRSARQQPAANHTSAPTARPTRAASAIEQDPTPAGATELPAAPLIQEGEPLLTNTQKTGPELFSIGGVSYKQNDDTLWFFGEVRNDGSAARELIELRVNLLDTNGKEIASKKGYASMSHPSPARSRRSACCLPKTIRRRHSRSTRSRFAAARPISSLATPTATCAFCQARRREGSVRLHKISGRVRNTGSQASQIRAGLRGVLRSAGQVVGLADSYAESANDAPLDARADARFEIQGVIFSGVPARYRLFAEGSKAN